MNLQPCGTRAAYQRHRSHGEKPCEECHEAHKEYMKRHRVESVPNFKAMSARGRALTRLKAEHLEEFWVLYDEEMGL